MQVQWVSEVKEIIDHMKKQKEFSLDFERLTIIGHSFGGHTCVEASWQIPDIKFCVPLDPGFLTRGTEIKEGKFGID